MPMVVAILLTASVALAATAKLQISSRQKLSSQFEAFREYIASLSEDDRQAWMAELAAIAAENDASGMLPFVRASAAQDDGTEQMVWIPRSGSRYHRTSTCSNMKDPQEVTVSEAISRGFTPCKRCDP